MGAEIDAVPAIVRQVAVGGESAFLPYSNVIVRLAPAVPKSALEQLELAAVLTCIYRPRIGTHWSFEEPAGAEHRGLAVAPGSTVLCEDLVSVAVAVVLAAAAAVAATKQGTS